MLAASVFLTVAQAVGAPSTQNPAHGPLTPADSARVVRAARSEQRGFESFRRARLPVRESYDGPCDVRVGRYCYWRGDEDDDEGTPPPEPPDITRRRDLLIGILTSASATIPGDAWLAGQRAFYLVEAGRIDDAVRFASAECRAGGSWCLALGGYAAHSGGRYTLADSLFAQSLAAMDTAERCRWLDVSELLDDRLARRFKPLDCEHREALARRVMRLGAPLLSVSETDVLTEHLARLTRVRIAEHAEQADRTPWGDDIRALMLRYGWPRWYSRNEPPFGSQLEPSVTGHDAGRPYDFLPSARAFDHTAQATDDDWELDDRRAPAGYAPRYLRTLHAVPHQFARFQRGDSTLVVAAWDARRDTTLLGRSLEVALVLTNDDSAITVTRKGDQGVTGRIVATGKVDSGLVSLELLARADRRAGRARAGIAPRGASTIALSDLLLYAPTDSAPHMLSDVADSAITSETVARASPLGVFWELYGVPDDEAQVRYSLSVEQIGVGWLRRIAERTHLTDPTSGLRVQWQERPERRNGIAARGVRLDLSRLRPGTYRVQLTVDAAGAPPSFALREITIR